MLPQTQEFHTREKRGREVKPQSTNKEAAQNFKRNELYSRKRTNFTLLPRKLRTHDAENPQTTQEHWIGLHQKPIKPLPSVSPPYVLLEIMIAEQAKPKEQTSIRIERKNRRETEGDLGGIERTYLQCLPRRSLEGLEQGPLAAVARRGFGGVQNQARGLRFSSKQLGVKMEFPREIV